MSKLVIMQPSSPGPASGTLRRLRFGDFDPATGVVTLTLRGNRPHPLKLDDPALWRDFERLKRLRNAEDDDVLLPQVVPRLAMKKPGPRPHAYVEGPNRYLSQRVDGRWETVTGR